MKNLIIVFILAFLSGSCNKNKQNDPAPAAQPSTHYALQIHPIGTYRSLTVWIDTAVVAGTVNTSTIGGWQMYCSMYANNKVRYSFDGPYQLEFSITKYYLTGIDTAKVYFKQTITSGSGILDLSLLPK